MSPTPTRAEPPATLLWPAGGDGPADVGVLCVHGIGVQDEGDALLAVARPLLAELASQGVDVSYGETSLKPTRQLDREPARMSTIVAEDAVTRRLLLAESWWARVFDPPSYWALLGWLLSYGTWIAIRHVVFSVSAPVRYFERKYDHRGQPRPDWLGFADVMFAYPGTLFSVFLVGIPMQVLLLAVGLLAIVPLKPTQRMVQRIAVALSSVLGDASVYTADIAIRQAILTRVRADFDWLAARSRTVVVLAHSQGAAVVFDLFRSIADLSNVRLVTYGAGIRKLSELEQDAQTRPLIVRLCGMLWLFGLVFFLVAWFAAAYTIESFASPGASTIGDQVGSLLLFYLLALGFLSILLYLSARGRDETIDSRLERDVSALLGKHLQWADLFASSDPVPGGPLLGARLLHDDGDGWRVDPALPGFRSREVVNRLSALTDHTAYWQPPNDFVPSVARSIRSWLGLPSPAEPLDLGRKRRVVFRRIAGLAISATAVAAFLRAGDPLRDRVWMPVWNLLPIEPASTTARIVARYGLREIVVFLTGLALYLGLASVYSRLVLEPAWNAWERTIQRYRRDAHPPAGNLFGVLTRFGHRLGPAVRFVICMLALVAPLVLLGGAIERREYGPTINVVITLGEWGREIVGWILGLVMVLGALVLLLAGVVRLWEWWQKTK